MTGFIIRSCSNVPNSIPMFSHNATGIFVIFTLKSFPPMWHSLRLAILTLLDQGCVLRLVSYVAHMKCNEISVLFFFNLSDLHLESRHFHKDVFYIFKFLWQKMWPIVCEQTDGQTEGPKIKTEFTKNILYFYFYQIYNFF